MHVRQAGVDRTHHVPVPLGVARRLDLGAKR